MSNAKMRAVPASLKTGDAAVDRVTDQLFGDDDKDDEKTPLRDLFFEALSKGWTYKIGRAIKSVAEGRVLTGLEAEADREMRLVMGRAARSFWVPYCAPVERRSLSTSTGAGSVTAQVPYMLLIDILRPKIALARLGARVLNLIGDGPKGTVQLPTKSAASTISWVSEGSSGASQSGPTIQGFTMRPYTATCYTDVTRRMMSLGVPEFETQVLDDISTGIAVAVDQAGLNGHSPDEPVGLFQLNGLPSIGAHGDSGNGGTITYSNLVAMKQIVGIYSGDAPLTARMGWCTSPQGRATLELTDRSATASTGRYCWESHSQMVDGQIVTLEHMLGYTAVSTTNVPAGVTEGSSTNVTVLAVGNWDLCWINLFSGFDCLVNPFLQTLSGVVRVTGYQDVGIRYTQPSGFCTCTNIASISPQIS